MRLKIKILSENYAFKTEQSEWGFSAHIDFNGTKYLFDTGQSGDCVLLNAKNMKVSLKDIEGIILSHGHYDHTGGLSKILKVIGPKKIYAHQQIFTARYSLENKKWVNSNPFFRDRKHYLNNQYPLNLCSELTELRNNVYLVGNVPMTNNFEKISKHFVISQKGKKIQDTFEDELHLVIDLPKGLFVLTGCAHRGIINILTHIKNLFNRNIYGFMGGTHLFEANDQQLKSVMTFIKKEKIQYLSPCHCSGINTIFKLQNMFSTKVKPSYSGTTHLL